jgi:hypothetical protein
MLTAQQQAALSRPFFAILKGVAVASGILK